MPKPKPPKFCTRCLPILARYLRFHAQLCKDRSDELLSDVTQCKGKDSMSRFNARTHNAWALQSMTAAKVLSLMADNVDKALEQRKAKR